MRTAENASSPYLKGLGGAILAKWSEDGFDSVAQTVKLWHLVGDQFQGKKG